MIQRFSVAIAVAMEHARMNELGLRAILERNLPEELEIVNVEEIEYEQGEYPSA